MKSIIYYFSGTGNSYYIAKRLSEMLSSRISSISEMPSTAKQYERIGIVCPVYATHVPSVVIQYIRNSTFSFHTHIFLVITYAGSHGYAAIDVHNEVKKFSTVLFQNYKIRMPGSSLLEYGAFPDKIQRSLLDHADKKVRKVADSIMKGAKTSIIRPNILACLFSRNAWKMINNYANKGLEFYTNDQCTKCKLCMKLCPVKNITWLDNQPVWENHCQQCMACIQWCTKNAICHPALEHKERKRYQNPYVTAEMLMRKDR